MTRRTDEVDRQISAQHALIPNLELVFQHKVFCEGKGQRRASVRKRRNERPRTGRTFVATHLDDREDELSKISFEQGAVRSVLVERSQEVEPQNCAEHDADQNDQVGLQVVQLVGGDDFLQEVYDEGEKYTAKENVGDLRLVVISLPDDDQDEQQKAGTAEGQTLAVEQTLAIEVDKVPDYGEDRQLRDADQQMLVQLICESRPPTLRKLVGRQEGAHVDCFGRDRRLVRSV